MNAIKNNPGRVAGLWYLLLVLAGPLRLIYIPNTLIVKGDAATTVNNIVAHDWLFRMGILSELAGALILIMLTMAFYRLFKTTDKKLAVLVVIFGGIMPGLLDILAAAGDATVLMIAHGASFLSAFDKPQQDALAMLFLKFGDHQTTASTLLWGVWLLPLAVLIYRCGFMPRWLGVWLYINGLAYVLLCLSGELFPQYKSMIFNYGQPAFFAEVGLMLWLVIRGGVPPKEVAA